MWPNTVPATDFGRSDTESRYDSHRPNTSSGSFRNAEYTDRSYGTTITNCDHHYNPQTNTAPRRPNRPHRTTNSSHDCTYRGDDPANYYPATDTDHSFVQRAHKPIPILYSGRVQLYRASVRL